MKRFRWMAMLAMWTATLHGGEAPAKLGTLMAGTLAPDFTATTVDGKPVRLSDFKGKTVVLSFWAPNRGPAGALESVAADYAAADVAVVGIGVSATREEFEQWVRKSKDNVSYPLAWDPAGKNAENSIAKKFGINAFPTTGVIDGTGKVVGGFTGFGAQAGALLRTYLRAAGAAIGPEEKSPEAVSRAGAGPGPSTEPPPQLKVGALAPNFQAFDHAGRPVNLSDFAGKIVVLDFWATWCAPCLAAMAHTQKVAAATKAQGVVVLAACTSDARADFEGWLKVNREKYPDILFANDPIGRDTPATYADRVSVKLYGVAALPTVFVIGRDGKVTDVLSGYDEEDTRLEEALKKWGVSL